VHIKEKIIGFIVFLIYRLYSFTFRYQIHFEGDDEYKTFAELKEKENYLIAFWHQDEMTLLNFFAYRKIGVLVSNSKDGTIMATLLSLLGYKIVRGSSSRNAVSGFIAALKLIRAGSRFTMAVDGPKGPIYKVKPGMIKLSEKTDRKIFPIRSWPENYWLFEKAWNKAKLPKPFSKVHITVGKPEKYSAVTLEEKLNSMTL
jgi:lysophospholipid acyltransferase (LPLAT)-like uncharacterized protein